MAAVLRVPAGRFPFTIRRIGFRIYNDSLDFRRAADTSVVDLGTEPTCLTEPRVRCSAAM